MKIVSKFKDYYDFAAGYDTDPRKVYVREKSLLDKNARHEGKDLPRAIEQLNNYSDRRGKYYKGLVFFCDTYYDYLYDTETAAYYYYYESIPGKIIKEFDSTEGKNRYADLDSLFRVPRKIVYKNDSWFQKTSVYDKPNKMIGAPVVYTWLNQILQEEYVINGCLNDIKFGAVKSPQEAYQELYNWIEFKEPETDAEPTNMNRFESKGFDKKTSFRKIK